MPIYSYRCAACGSEFEELRRMSDPAPACPACASAEVKQLPARTVAGGKAGAFIEGQRRRAMKEGHFSNYSTSETARIKR